jgi:hypothetical protein
LELSHCDQCGVALKQPLCSYCGSSQKKPFGEEDPSLTGILVTFLRLIVQICFHPKKFFSSPAFAYFAPRAFFYGLTADWIGFSLYSAAKPVSFFLLRFLDNSPFIEDLPFSFLSSIKTLFFITLHPIFTVMQLIPTFITVLIFIYLIKKEDTKNFFYQKALPVIGLSLTPLIFRFALGHWAHLWSFCVMLIGLQSQIQISFFRVFVMTSLSAFLLQLSISAFVIVLIISSVLMFFI